MNECFYRSENDTTPFDAGEYLVDGNNQEVFVRKPDEIVFKLLKLSGLGAHLLQLDEYFSMQCAEFNSVEFCEKILSAYAKLGVPFPEDWLVQNVYINGEYRIGFWQTYYKHAIENAHSPWSKCVEDGERAFFQADKDSEPVFIDWDSTLLWAFQKLEKDFTVNKLDQVCNDILTWEKPEL